MAEPLISAGLAKDWISRLWELWARIRDERAAELREIENAFGPPELLAKTYVEPDCQRTNPADHHEDEPIRTFRQPIRAWINDFLKGPFFERDGRNTLFVLSDAGMGKSSLMMMLKFSHMARFWPSELDFKLLKLGPETLDALRAIRNRAKTVLLLDALDEDPTAWGRIEERLDEILQEGKGFRQVILTCRTQFFPKGGQGPVERPEKVEVAGFVCNLLYLSPFSDAQVEAYLRKRFPNTLAGRLRKWLTDKDNERLDQARRLVLPMRSLRMRPMLLSYVDVLMEAGVEDLREFSVYKALVERWLLREESKQKGGPTKEELWQACAAVAMHLQASGQRTLTREELRKLLVLHPVAEHIRLLDVGGRSLMNLTSDGSYRFAHYSIQEFLVAHRLVDDERPAPEGIVRSTDLILSFLNSWVLELPGERQSKVPWDRLDLRNNRLDRLGFDMVYVPAGEFTLGSSENDDARPVHKVVLSSFWIGKYPVTNEQYRRFLEANPEREEPPSWGRKRFNGPQQPVVGVSWSDAMAYCRWAGVELPSEAQWEAAARGTDAREYPWGNEKPTAQHAKFGNNPSGWPDPVGRYPAGAGPYGTMDQAGNVWEWCLDRYEGTAYRGRDGQVDPVVSGDENAEKVLRVMRGGSWDGPSEYLRAAVRGGSPVRGRSRHLGFRVLFRSSPEP